ncbi:protein SEEDLING PLASTID DEVELOPMENT 1 isoform X2 [Magnolia sinica]|uniref:protein SEEDLING PLASTID DEVELOPMENT 1 isoform X2 n=1 Tax=Magnolia sinica TaxID=86752 RepID=UPI00265AF1F4|nr:protein SEEDLING PLASTID DEVELOPMENT 1 isoform X2 [Magnolia sinica]
MRMLALPREGLIAPMLQLPLPPPTPTKQTFRTSQQKSASLRSQPFSVCYKCKFISSPISSFPKSPTKRLNSCSNSSAPTTDDDFDVELGRLLALLPDEMRRKVSEHPDRHHLIEIVMDLGRTPLARFPSGDFVLSDQPITFADLEHATSQVGDFATDNRAGISRTLHRISAIRNRKGVIIGLTCRVGRAISGSANLLRDLVKDGDSLLLIGPPGVGKTTIIREIARMLADDHSKRVMIVDTSNEIGGDGDIPHEGIGAARRMQVPNSDMQHKVLIEAVENHMPQVIVIDEISTKLEAVAASTIAQRGIQLVSTAHGVTIENLIMNPSLEMLVGGIQSVTLGDEEASRRGVQKTVLERRGPSTFTCGVEIISKTELRVHRSLEATVDALLSGRSPNFEVCKINSQGFAHEMVAVPIEPFSDISSHEQDEIVDGDLLEINDERISYNEFTSEFAAKMEEIPSRDEVQLHLYVYGTSSLLQITKAIRAFVSKHADGFKDLEAEDKMSSSEKIDALEEARLAIEQIVIPKGEPVELLPRSPAIRSLQMDLAKKYQLQSEKVGEEPDARVCILPLHAARTEGNEFDDGLVDSVGNFNNSSSPSDINGSCNSMTKLPFLPD